MTFNLTVNSDGSGGVIASGSYTYNSPAMFGNMIGKKIIPVSGSMTATAHPTTYVTYYILVDTSQSMGIGTTQADMNNLYTRVATYKDGGGDIGCVFGCHVLGPGQTLTNEYLAHNVSPPITLRIDSAVAAIQTIVSAANSIAGSTRNISFALYTIQNDPTTQNVLGKILTPPSSNYSTVSTRRPRSTSATTPAPGSATATSRTN